MIGAVGIVGRPPASELRERHDGDPVGVSGIEALKEARQRSVEIPQQVLVGDGLAGMGVETVEAHRHHPDAHPGIDEVGGHQ